MFKNKANQGVYIFAYDTIANTSKTGDAANITANISKNGAANSAVDDTNPTEIGSGVYWFDLTKAETNANAIAIAPVSSTGGIQIDIVTLYPKRQIPGTVIHEGTAQGAGIGSNQIQLDNLASAVDGSYDPSLVVIVDGTGAGQTRLILEYKGSTRTATVDRNWKVNPAADSEFQIVGNAGREHVNEGLAQAGTSNTITLNVLASSDNKAYKNQMVFIRSGTGEDQVRRIAGYNGTSKIAIVSSPWDVTPDSTSGYVMLPLTCVEVQAVRDKELDSFAGINFNTYFNNGSVASDMQIDIHNADTKLVLEASGWYTQWLRKGGSSELMRKLIKDINQTTVTGTGVVVGGKIHTASP